MYDILPTDPEPYRKYEDIEKWRKILEADQVPILSVEQLILFNKVLHVKVVFISLHARLNAPSILDALYQDTI